MRNRCYLSALPMNPTPTFTHNAFALLANDSEDDDDEDSNDNPIHSAPHTHTTVEHAISDSGATGHFMVEGAPVTNIQRDLNPISITLPDGATLQSTHTCNLDIPWLPATVTAAHIVPGLSHSSLIEHEDFVTPDTRSRMTPTHAQSQRVESKS